MAMHRLSMAALLCLGCAGTARLNVQAAACINPASGQCRPGDDATDSRIMEIRLYQLKQRIEPCPLDWNGIAENKDLDLLKQALTDPQRVDLVRRIEQLTPRESRKLSPWGILKDTRYVLAVAVGRGRTRNTVRLLPISKLARERTLYVRGYDLCIDNSCEFSLEAECP